MLERIGHILQRWTAPSLWTRRRPSSGADASELQTLASERRNSQDRENVSYKKDAASSSLSTLLNTPKAGAERYLGPRFAGWRFGALNFAVWALIVFLINLTVTIWGSAAAQNGRGVFFDGDCDRVKRLNTGLHVFINILSTILLGGSNYCMQAMSAPTSGEVMIAHAKGKWLDIGVPGLRNLRHISRQRTVLWCLLGLSSLPLHLL